MTRAGEEAATFGPATRPVVSGRTLVEAGWLTAALLIPVAVNPWGANPFVPIKVALLRTLVWTMLAVAALDTVRAGDETRIAWRSPIAIPAAVWAVVLVAATAFAADPSLALWGGVDRGQGVLTQLSYVALGLLVAANLDTAAAARRLFAAIIGATALLVVVSAFQAAGLHGGLVSDARSPVHGLLGRSNFLAAELVMALPLVLVWTAVARQKIWRWGSVLLAAAVVAVLAATDSRAGWIAAAVASAAVLAGIRADRLRTAWKRMWVRLTVGICAVAAAAGGLAAARAGASGEARLVIWQACFQLLFERPLLGYGPDNLGLVFPRVYPADLVYHQGRWGLVDRAHSWPIDLLMTAGVAGLVAFLVVLAAAIVTAVRVLALGKPSPDNRMMLAAVVAGVVGGATVHILSFEVTATATLGWLLLGAAAAAPKWTADTQTTASTSPPSSGRPTIAAAVVGAVLAALIAVFNGRQVVADSMVLQAQVAAADGRTENALQATEHALDVWPRAPDWHALRARLLAHRFVDEGGDPGLLRLADAALADGLRRSPLRFDLWFARAEIATLAAGAEVPGAADLADRCFRKAAALAPQHAVILHHWSRLDRTAGSLATAEQKLRKAVDLDASSAAAWTELGEVQLQRGRLDEAGTSFTRAIGIDETWLPAWLGTAVLHARLGDFDRAAAALSEALALAPDSPEVARVAEIVAGSAGPAESVSPP